MSYLKLKLQADRTNALNFKKHWRNSVKKREPPVSRLPRALKELAGMVPAFLMITKMCVND